jgi:hypothetical protein
MTRRVRSIAYTTMAVVLAAAAACDAPSAARATPEVIDRPPIPPGWTTISSDAGDVRLTLPPDFEALFTGDGVIAQPAADEAGGAPGLEIMALGPVSVVPQPASGEPMRTWLDASSWVPRAGDGGVTRVSGRADRELVLPAGRAIEVAVTVDPGTDAASRVVVYAIATDDGIAVLRFVGFPPVRFEERADEMLLVAALVGFGAERD